jgi:hypothetical protein
MNPDQQSNVNEFDISGLEAMLAGTLCLMSAYSHGNCNNDNTQDLIGLKIISNLNYLQCQNSLSEEFRLVLSKVRESWQQHGQLLGQTPGQIFSPAAAPTSRWHQAPAVLQ